MGTPDFSGQIAELRHLLLNESDFSVASHCFQDNLAENDQFLSPKACHSTNKAHKLELLLTKAAEAFVGMQPLKLTDLAFLTVLRLRGTPLHHGAFHIAGYLCGFFYFDDIGVGMLTFAELASAKMHYVRLNAKSLGEVDPLN